ncbi:hypothetical protein [Erwinia sp. JUb26]|uniref:hypothetical protein n=1 Tax=Erwinia sp. JUb26 TaxID=2485126 RepID=UPI000F492566|nr:hypothetical protein [Erwinia sp. JUb26]ROR06910.1 hypothetical protein EC836_107194 [Erwinia sp. JUb26]
MKILCAVLSVLLLVALGYIFLQHQGAPEKIALLDVERIIAESAPGKAGREHLNIIDRGFQKGMEDLLNSYRNASEEEQQRVMSHAEETLVGQFSVEERRVSDALKKIIYEEAEKWRKQHDVGAIFPAQLALVSSDRQLDCTDEILATVDQRQITFADLPVLQINQPPAIAPVSPFAKKKADEKTTVPEVTEPNDTNDRQQKRSAAATATMGTQTDGVAGQATESEGTKRSSNTSAAD